MTPKVEDARGIRGFWGLCAGQFLGAFNDNAFRWFLIALAMKELPEVRDDADVIVLAAGLFLLPFLIFSMHSGSLADRLSKRTVLMWAKAAEAAIMFLAAAFLFIEEENKFYYLCFMLFLLGIQATYYSPAKFGTLPEILPESRLSWGNGVLELTGFIAIVTGSAAGPLLLSFNKPYLAPVLFSAAALLGLLGTAFLPRLAPAAPDRPLRLNPLRDLLDHGGKLLAHRLLLLTLLGIVYIWSLGLFFQLNVAMYSKVNLGLPETHLGSPMAVVAIGVGLGCLAAGYLSGKTIEVGLVPVGATGIAIAAVGLYLTPASRFLSFAAIAILGFFAGFFIVPTHALLQEESDEEDKGGIWAATNFLQTLGMLLAASFFWLLTSPLSMAAEEVFLIVGAGTILGAGAIAFFLPETIGRLIAWLLRFPARVRVSGQEHIPPRGPILFIADGPPARGYLLLAGTRRFVRFVLPAPTLASLPWRALGRWLRAVPLDAAGGETAVRDAFRRAEEDLARGEAVCVFREIGSDNAKVAAGYRSALDHLVAKGIAPAVEFAIQGPPPRGGRGVVLAFHRAGNGTLAERDIAAALDAAPGAH